MKNPLESLLTKQRPSRIPIWYMRQAGRYLPEYMKLRQEEPDFIKFCLNSKLCVEAALQPMCRFDLDASILFADILLIPYILGQKVKFEKNIGPLLEPINFPNFLDKYDINNLKKLKPVYKTIINLKKNLKPEVDLIGFSGGVWTLACYMLAGRSEPNQESAKKFMFSKTEYFDRLIDILTETVSEYLIAQIEAGANVIQIFDSWSGVLPATQFESYVIKPTAKIITKIKKRYSEIPVIGFPRNAGAMAANYATQTGISAISIDPNQPFDWVKKNIQKHIPVQGNLDPQLAVVGGVAMFNAAENILNNLTENGLVFGLGHGIVPQTPPENILALTQFVREWERKH